MEKVGVRELKQNASAVLRRVKAGETVEVTERGQPVARIVPVTLSHWEQLIAQGKIIPAEKSWAEVSREHPPLPLKPGEKGLTEILLEMREEERY